VPCAAERRRRATLIDGDAAGEAGAIHPVHRRSGDVTLKVIGAGFGRTGTLSLKSALETVHLGPCYHMVEVFARPDAAEQWLRAASRGSIDWEEIYGDYQATVDWPGCAFWRELIAAYPAAKVVLSVRDPEKWWESASETILRQAALPPSEDPGLRRIQRVSLEVVHDRSFGGRFPEKESFIAAFEEHNAAVIREVPADRLLVYEVTDGWGPLCEFLGVEAPDAQFPNVNDREFFRAIWGIDD